MPSMLFTVNISKGFKTWTNMVKSLEDETGAQGAKVVWAGANPDETAIYMMVDVPGPEFMQTFSLRLVLNLSRSFLAFLTGPFRAA